MNRQEIIDIVMDEILRINSINRPVNAELAGRIADRVCEPAMPTEICANCSKNQTRHIDCMTCRWDTNGMSKWSAGAKNCPKCGGSGVTGCDGITYDACPKCKEVGK